MREIIIIQHCQSEHHINNMTGGWTDTPLTDLGRLQAEQIGVRLSKELISEYVMYSSDLLRAKQTAEIIGKYMKLDIIEDMELREINTGIAIGKTKDWARVHRNPRNSNNFEIDYREYQFGETWREFFDRVCKCMKRIYNSNEKNLIIVTHGGTLGYIVAWWLDFKHEMLINSYFSSSVGSISVLQINTFEQHVLTKLNDTSHFLQTGN
jgi:broad specificity phosphatase PhoE